MIKKTFNITDAGVIINEKEQKFEIFGDKGYLFKARSHFRKSYSDIKLSDMVTDINDFAKVHLLAEHIYKDTNTIMKQVSVRKIRVADIDDISLIIGVNVRRTKEFLNRMQRLHVIAERNDVVGNIISTKYVINPLFFNSNKHITADLYFLFQESLDKHLPQWVISKFHEISNIKKV
jgi:hypothetical protein